MTSDPLNPLAARRASALPPLCSAVEELSKPVDEVPVAGVLAVEVLADELEVFEEDDDALVGAADPLELETGGGGEKLSFDEPKPMFCANRPVTETELILFNAEITR